jgi:hypothetical protein
MRGVEHEYRCRRGSKVSVSLPASYLHFLRITRRKTDTRMHGKERAISVINPYKSYISVISVCVYIKTAAASPHGARMCASDIIPVPVRFLPHSLTKTRASRRPRCLPPRVSNPPIKQAMDEVLPFIQSIEVKQCDHCSRNDDSVCSINSLTQQCKSDRTSAGRPLPCRKRRRWSRRSRPWGSRRGSAGA